MLVSDEILKVMLIPFFFNFTKKCCFRTKLQFSLLKHDAKRHKIFLQRKSVFFCLILKKTGEELVWINITYNTTVKRSKKIWLSAGFFLSQVKHDNKNCIFGYQITHFLGVKFLSTTEKSRNLTKPCKNFLKQFFLRCMIITTF